MRFIGIDAHKDMLQVAILDDAGELVREARITLNRDGLARLIRLLHKEDRVIIEATTNAFTLHDTILPHVAQVVVSNPIKTRIIAEAKVKTDKIDARVLAELLRIDAYYPVWVPPVKVRKRRSLVSLYYQLQKTTTRIRNRIHAIFQRALLPEEVEDLFSPAGSRWLDQVELSVEDRFELDLLRRTLEETQEKLQEVVQRIEEEAVRLPEVLRLMQVPGINRLSAYIIMAEIGEISRFSAPKKLTSYAGLVPRIHQSNQKAYTGRITKAGRRHLRWIMIQVATVAARYNPQFQGFYQRLRAKKGHNVAVTALARKLLEVTWHLLAREETYQSIDVNKYVRKLMESAWSVKKSGYPGGAKGLVTEGLRLLGLSYPEEGGKPLSLNALRKGHPQAQAWAEKIQMPTRRFVLTGRGKKKGKQVDGKVAS